MEFTITEIASWLTGAAVIVAAVFKLADWLRKPGKHDEAIKGLHEKHDADMKAMQTELTIICYGLRGALQGLVENGCNGPCKEALQMLDKHLNKSAHEQ